MKNLKEFLYNVSTMNLFMAVIFFAVATIWVAIQKNAYGFPPVLVLLTGIFMLLGIVTGLTSVFLKTK